MRPEVLGEPHHRCLAPGGFPIRIRLSSPVVACRRPSSPIAACRRRIRQPRTAPCDAPASCACLIEPRFLKRKQPQKPHNKLEKAQMMLRENKLNLELKLGGESDNPTSKGIPQPPLWRKSIRGAWSFSLDARQRPRECIARSRFWTRLSFFSFFFFFLRK